MKYSDLQTQELYAGDLPRGHYTAILGNGDLYQYGNAQAYLNSLNLSLATVTSDTVLTLVYTTVLIDSSGGNVTVTLPLATSYTGKIMDVKVIDGTNTCTVDTAGENIDDVSSLELFAYESITVQSDGTQWWII